MLVTDSISGLETRSCLQARGGGGGRAAQQAVHNVEHLLHALVRAHLFPSLEHPTHGKKRLCFASRSVCVSTDLKSDEHLLHALVRAQHLLPTLEHPAQ